MEKKNILKSRTFWGAIVFGAVKVLESVGVIPSQTAAALESVAVALGLWGARNAKA